LAAPHPTNAFLDFSPRNPPVSTNWEMAQQPLRGGYIY